MPPFPTTSLPYAPSAAQITADPQLVETARDLAWSTCERATSIAASTVVGSGAVVLAQHFSATGIGSDLVKLETLVTRLLGEIEARFILGVIPPDVEGYLDLLAAYNSLVLENSDERYNLLNMNALMKTIDCISKTVRVNKFTVVRLQALLERCQTTKNGADRRLLAEGRPGMPHVTLVHGYHPSGSAPWRCPVLHMPVNHNWLYDADGNPLSEKTLKRWAIGLDDTTGPTSRLIAYRRGTRQNINVYNHKKERYTHDPRLSYNLLFEENTGLAYMRILFVRIASDGSKVPVEPPRSAPANWPPQGPIVEPIALPSRMPAAYYPPESEEAVPQHPITRQYTAQPSLNVGLGASSGRVRSADTAYPPYPIGAYGSGQATAPASAAPVGYHATYHQTGASYGHATASTYARPAGQSSVPRPHVAASQQPYAGYSGPTYRNNINREN